MVVDGESLDSPLFSWSPRVLVVDDHDDSRDMYATFLTQMGCRVSQAARGREVLSLLQRDPHDAVILDLVLPDVDGFEILRRVRQTPALADIKMMVVSALTPLTEAQRRTLNEGRPDAVFVKPCGLDILLSQLRELMAHGRVLRERTDAGRARTTSLVRRAHELHRHAASLHDIARKLVSDDG